MAIGQITRDLDNDSFEAIVGAAAASSSNVFATINDLPDTLYSANGTAPDGRVVTLGGLFTFARTTGSGGVDPFWIQTDGTSPHQKRVFIGRSALLSTYVASDFHYVASDTSGMIVEGFNSNDGQNALRIYNGGRGLRIAAFENNSDIIFCEDTTATRARFSVGTVNPFVNSKMTVRGVNTSPGAIALYVGGSAGSAGMQINNDDRLGFGGMGTTQTKVNFRASSGQTTILNLARINGTRAYEFLEDGLLKFNQAAPTGGWGTALVTSSLTNSITTGATAAHVASHTITPPSNGTVVGYGFYSNTVKNGTFNASAINGVYGLGRNVGTGTLSQGIRGGLFEGRNDTVIVGTQSRMVGAEFNTISIGNSTITDVVGARITATNNSSGTYNLTGVIIESPLNAGATIAQTKGIWAKDNTFGTTNWGLYIEGATRFNYLQGALGIGVASPDASALLEMSSTTKGFCPPRMTTVQRNGIASPLKGLIVYDTDLDQWMGNNGTPGVPNWVIIG